MFLDTPLERLHLDTELVRCVQHDPELVRRLAKSSFRTILSVNHPDVGGDGRFVDEASDAMSEINGASDEDLTMIVSEFFAIRDSEGDGIERARVQQAAALLTTEEMRRRAEVETVFTCAFAEKPAFSTALIELGISPYKSTEPYTTGSTDEELSLMGSHEDSPKPQFVITDSSLTGSIVAVGDSRGYFDFDSKSIAMDQHGNAIVSGADANAKTGDLITTELQLTPTQQWKQHGAMLLGMIERYYVEAPEDSKSLGQRLLLPRAVHKAGQEYEPSWESVSNCFWLEHMTSFSRPDTNLENKYVVIAKPEASMVAILGLCRKLAS